MTRVIGNAGKAALVAAALVTGAAVVSATTPVANAQSTTLLPATMMLVKPAVLDHSQVLGPVSEAAAWHFDVVLPSKDPAGLAAFSRAVSTPGSSVYHQFLTHAQLMARYGPSASEVAQLTAYLAGRGMTAHQVGQMMTVSGTAGQVDSLFQTTLTQYRYHGRDYVAPNGTIRIPAALETASGFSGLYDAMPVPGAIAQPFSAARLVQHISTGVPTQSSSETTASSGGMTVTAQLLSQGPRVPGMAERYLITATYNGQPDTSAAYSSLSGSYQGASSLVDTTATNGNGQFLLDFSLSEPQTVSLDLTVTDGNQNSVTVPLPAADFSGPAALTTSTLTLDGVPGTVIAPWNPSSNPVTRVFGASVLSNETAAHGPAHLAVFTAGNVTSISQSDVTHFATQFGLAQPRVTVAYSGPNVCTAASCGTVMVPIEEELSLDLQMMETSAPGSNIQIYEAGSLRSALNQVVTQDTANVFSISYGEGEIPEQQYYATAQSNWDTLAQEANAEGITITVSAGDSGGYAGALEYETQPMLSYPANSPDVTALGGLETSVSPLLTINQNAMWGGNVGAELPQTTLLSFLELQNMMAGGGYSLLEPRPSYQNGFVPGHQGRGNPDVSFPASVVTPGYFAYFANVPFNFGGTSASAPLFAGWVGDLNLTLGHPQGNINPALYQLAGTSSTPFMPVAYGNNGAYGLTPGAYNPVTGLGPANMDNLLTQFQHLQ